MESRKLHMNIFHHLFRHLNKQLIKIILELLKTKDTKQLDIYINCNDIIAQDRPITHSTIHFFTHYQ